MGSLKDPRWGRLPGVNVGDLIKIPNSGAMDDEKATTSCTQTGPQWNNKDTNPPTKLSTPNLCYLKEMQGQNWRLNKRQAKVRRDVRVGVHLQIYSLLCFIKYLTENFI